MDWMKYRLLYFSISLLVIIPGVYSLVRFGLKLSIDFTGGSNITISMVDKDKLISNLKDHSPEIISQSGNNLTVRTKTITQEELDKIGVTVGAFETLGPAMGQETIKKTVYAIILACLLLLIHISRAFKQLKFGVCAIIAMLHDSLVLLGSFSLLGHFFNVEVDLLFVTAMLTVLSFSVHDTIVVYDRIREMTNKKHGVDIKSMANQALSETMVRSIVNSLTIIFMLIDLVLLGGDTTRNFAIALLIGSISGAYSSPFNAVPILVTWDEFRKNR